MPKLPPTCSVTTRILSVGWPDAAERKPRMLFMPWLGVYAVKTPLAGSNSARKARGSIGLPTRRWLLSVKRDVSGALANTPSTAARSPLSYSKARLDRKSTRLNSSHVEISYAVFCLKKKKNQQRDVALRRHSPHARRRGREGPRGQPAVLGLVRAALEVVTRLRAAAACCLPCCRPDG